MPFVTAARPRAKSVICLFQHGGPSQMDLFDPKPALAKHHGKPYPGRLEIHFNTQAGNMLASPFRFRPRGQSGMVLSELLPHTAAIADDLTLIRSMTTESVDHEAALRLIHTGKILAGRPTWGSWVVYALGSENHNLPSYVVLSDPGGLPVDGVRNWSSGWLPAIYQGTPFRSGGTPVLNLETPRSVTTAGRESLSFVSWTISIVPTSAAIPATPSSRPGSPTSRSPRGCKQRFPRRSIWPASLHRSAGCTAWITRQPASTRTRCLIARRLVERGVRFVQLFLSGQPWDTHSKNAETLKSLCAMTDQPSAALVRDLKQRGLLDETIVLWTGEFGRLPVSQGTDGRDHNRHGFSLWLAGGGFRRGYVHGATDDFGYAAVDDIVSVHDLQSTLLLALGLDHRKLTYPFEGRRDSLTDPEVTKARLVPRLLS